jgi:hypothetical protein
MAVFSSWEAAEARMRVFLARAWENRAEEFGLPSMPTDLDAASEMLRDRCQVWFEIQAYPVDPEPPVYWWAPAS